MLGTAAREMSVTALRFFTVYGPRQRPDMAIPRFAKLIASGEPVTLYGDGSSSRDYTYIRTPSRASSPRWRRTCPATTSINLGRGKPPTLSDLVRLIELGLDVPANVRYEPDQPGDPQSTCADITRARQKLGYEPAVAPQEGIIRYTEWFLETRRELAGSR